MKLNLIIFLSLFIFQKIAYCEDLKTQSLQQEFIRTAQQIEFDTIRYLPVLQNGRLKPLDTMARESILFINGSYSRNGLHPVQTYLALGRFESANSIEIIELRDVELRKEIGFLASKRFYSVRDLEVSPFKNLVEPVLKKQEQNSKNLSAREKSILELFQQVNLVSEIISVQQLMLASDFQNFQDHSQTSRNSQISEWIPKLYQSFSLPKTEQIKVAKDFIEVVKNQKIPDLYENSLNTIEIEVFFNDMQFFLLAAVTSLFVSFAFILNFIKKRVSKIGAYVLCSLPVALLIIGLGLRVYITRFAPVTNMYTTMIWVALGVMLFSLVLFYLYENYNLLGYTLLTSGCVLLLTHQIPLILSPDLDPIVAVLRNNFWLSTHVTTITISYAAFTIAMVFGNIALVRSLIFKEDHKFVKEYAHYTYRMIQLGCFLLTAGIILGGIWADYSWGRFWGWDPKETWALIADLGFLTILHSRITGWVKDFNILALSPVAYLLVIMAWYGVNFILGAGLHSYGFSSGGAMAMGIFVTVQLVLLLMVFVKHLVVKQQRHG